MTTKAGRAMRLVSATVLIVLLASACSERKSDSSKVVDIVDVTTPLARRFTYTVTQRGTTLTVQGIVEDDFRYKMQLAAGSTPAVEEIVVDDGAALRLLDPSFLKALSDPKVTATAATDTPGVSVSDALNGQRWVFDDAGAPPPVVATDDTRALGDDPLEDARNALGYVRTVALGTPFVRYDPESLNPVYRTDEDPFPKPETGSKVVRYDAAVYPHLPPVSEATSGNQSVLPGYGNFRKMAVYVEDGHIIRVMEDIGLPPRLRDELRDYLDALVKGTAPTDVYSQFAANVAHLANQPDQLGVFLLQALNSFVEVGGRPGIQFRTMTLELSDLGHSDLSVSLPTDNVLKGSLAGEGARPQARHGCERLDDHHDAHDRARPAVTARKPSMALLLALTVALVACGGGSGSGTAAPVTYVRLDGTPRVPNDEGVVTAMADDLSTFTLDDLRTYHTDPSMQSFSTVDGSTQPLKRRLHQYVQVGLRGTTALWVAGIADVVATDGQPGVAYYTGVPARVSNREVDFADGTVLILATSVDPPPIGALVLATIDVASHKVSALAAAG